MIKVCKECGRDEGHFIGCPSIPKPVDSVCQQPGCEDPVKSGKASYCAQHSTPAAAAARSRAKKENENV